MSQPARAILFLPAVLLRRVCRTASSCYLSVARLENPRALRPVANCKPMLAFLTCRWLGRGMNTLPRDKKVLIVTCFADGVSIRATARVADVQRNRVAKLAVDAGKVCGWFQDAVLRGLRYERIEVDDIWSFVYAKEHRLGRTKSAPPEAGSVWTWAAIDPHTKLVPSWWVGDRSVSSGNRGPPDQVHPCDSAPPRWCPSLLWQSA